MEEIKIFDANLNELGTMERNEAHLKAQWHKTFHCWIIDRKNKKILFQLRSTDKKTFPGCLDVSAAGHIIADEKISDGIREISEELGISIPFKNLYPLGCRVEVCDLADGQNNREYQYVYFAITDGALEFNPQAEEVAGLLWISIDDALKLFIKETKNCQADGMIFDNQSKRWEKSNQFVTLDDFIPRIQNYYLTIAIMADRVLKGQYPLAIS